jgi:hypothetical protein
MYVLYSTLRLLRLVRLVKAASLHAVPQVEILSFESRTARLASSSEMLDSLVLNGGKVAARRVCLGLDGLAYVRYFSRDTHSRD